MNHHPTQLSAPYAISLCLGLLLGVAVGGCAPTVAPPQPTRPPATATATLVSSPTPEPTAPLVPTPTAPLPTATPPMAASSPTVPGASEQPVQIIALAGPLAEAEAEISGMAWWGERLLLLPQYPAAYGEGGAGALFTLPKADILAVLNGALAGPLTPQPLPMNDGGLADSVAGFEGFEAIAIAGERAFLTIEASAGSGMQGYLVAGTLTPDALTLDASTRVEIPPQAALDNFSDESVLVAGERLLTLYEANGAAVNPAPIAHSFSLTLEPLDPLPLAPIEYRLTDATTVDEQGRFWAINVFWPGDMGKLRPQEDALTARFGEGSSHQRWMTVERLVEFQIGETGIAPTERPPLQLVLVNDLNSRNWEGIARVEGRGFLLVTDSFPATLLAFVADPVE